MGKRGRPGPGILDIYVGRRVRARRMALHMSMEQLAEHLDVTIQQMQKYEHGLNRISANRLPQFSAVLAVSLDFFFAGAEVLRQEVINHPRGQGLDLDAIRDLCDLMSAYADAPSFEERQAILRTVRSASERQLKERAGVLFVLEPRRAVPARKAA